MRKWFLLTALFISFTSCQAQVKKPKRPPQASHPVIMAEKFDFEDYKRRMAHHPPQNIYTAPDGSRIEMWGDEAPVVKIQPPAPSFEEIYKEFHPNGNLSMIGTYLGKFVKVGVWKYYDETGKLIEEHNEDRKFGKVKPADILRFLEKKGYINIRTGSGRNTFELSFPEEESILAGEVKKKTWFVTITEGVRNTNIPKGRGEPKAFNALVYEIDGETGAVIQEFTE